MLIGNFEQHFESYVMNTQMLSISLNISKNELMKIVRGFCVFRICSMAKNENAEMPEISRKLSK